jgi:hypothetical protein
MSRISAPLKESVLFSPRTANYVSSFIREGDKFDYCTWLQGAREEEAQAKRAAAAFTSGALVSAEIGNSVSKCQCRGAWPNSGPAPMTRAAPLAVARSSREARNETPRARLRGRLEKVRDAWDDFQASRARDAVYGYLEAVFAIVEHYKVRRRTTRLRRHAFRFANLPFNNSSDLFAAVIRCTSGDGADNKTVSKWARALRYASRSKEPAVRLRTFMKEAGGVNACADLYTRYFGRGTK